MLRIYFKFSSNQAFRLGKFSHPGSRFSIYSNDRHAASEGESLAGLYSHKNNF